MRWHPASPARRTSSKVAYASTASWIAGVAGILPFLGTLIAIAGGIYCIYLIYLGLPHTMKCPPERAIGYTAVTIIIGFVLSLIIGAMVGGLVGTSALTSGAATSRLGGTYSDVTIDKDSALGELAEYGKKMGGRQPARGGGQGKRRRRTRPSPCWVPLWVAEIEWRR